MTRRSPFRKPLAPSRRSVLRATAGAFVLGAYIPSSRLAFAAVAVPSAGGPDPNVFLKITADGTVTVISKHSEMGQGITTGLATMVADELDADWSTVRFEFAPANAKLYNNLQFGSVMGTGRSTSTAEAWLQMRQVGAEARAMFVAAAAAKWHVPARDITVAAGVLRHKRSGRSAGFGELAEAAMRVPVPAKVTLKTAKDWTLIGTPLPRLDSQAKTHGTAVFATDIRRPGMLTAVVKRPDRFGAVVASFDPAGAKAVDGVVDVVQIPMGVAVLAQDTWAAIRGRDTLKITWDDSKAEGRSSAELMADYRQQASGPGLSAVSRGDPSAALGRAAKTVEAEFTFPYLAHAPMEPLNAVIELSPGGAEIWSGCQLQTADQTVAARVLGLVPEQVTIHTLFGGGSFGRRGNPVGDWTAELAEIAKAITGRAPVHLVWTREDDIKGGFYRPMVLHQVKAGIDAAGRVAGWQHKIVAKSIFDGTPFEGAMVHDGLDAGTTEGAADTAYAIPDFAVDVVNVQSPITVLGWRSVGHSHTAHVMETVVDELAVLAGADPAAFRAGLLAKDARALAVLKLAADKSDWLTPLPAGRGRGIAYHETFGTRVAMVAEVTATGTTVTVDRIVAAVDCGIAVNPDGIESQIEGAVGFALSSVFRNQVTFDGGVVVQENFDDYEPTLINEMPRVDVHIVGSTAPPTGIYDPGVPPLAPAIGNAIFAATGRRLRSLPFDLKSLA